jgi:NADH-quinone oxidoreductase subunit M
MLLSAIMLKMGLYGLIRWFFPLVPEAYHIYAPIIMGAAVAGVLYGAIIAIRQQDMKRLIAFSSLSHVGLIAAGIATLNYTGVQGALIQMFNHGINVLGLFLVVDVIQQRTGTRDLGQLGGIAKQAPLFAVAFMIVMLATSAVPFTNGFPGELLLLKGIFTANAVWGVFAGLTIILCAVYMFRMYQFSMFGTEKNGVYLFPDLNMREILVFGVLVALIIGIGVFPQWMLDLTGPSVKKTLEIIENTVGVIA